MPDKRSCIVKEFCIPEREYRVSPPECWDAGINRRGNHTPPRRIRRRRRRRSHPPVMLLLGLALFCGGVWLGGGAFAREAPPPEDGTVQISILPLEDGDGRTSPDAAEKAAIPGQAAVLGQAAGSSAPGEASDGSAWNLLLVNRDSPLPESFEVPELIQLKNGHAVDSRIYPELQRMMDGARAAGLEPLICSSFRTWDKQESLFANKVRRLLAQGYGQEEAEEEAALWVARPGTSEHQAGLAVDIVDRSYQLLDEGQESTAVQKWLMAHCAEYGFILRYPTEKSSCTGVGYEPWHYRYVGREAAEEIMGQGLCLEEYLERLSKP